jgi:hypothetical protein
MISDDDVKQYEKMCRKDKEYVHGQLAVEAARIQGILPNGDEMWKVDNESCVDIAREDVDDILDDWQHEMDRSMTESMELEVDTCPSVCPKTMKEAVIPISNLWMPMNMETQTSTLENKTDFIVP